MSRKTQPQVTVPTVTDEQYKQLLETRLAAMHGFAEGTVDADTKNAARRAVRNARKVRATETENGVLPAYRQHLEDQAEARSAAAKKAASTRKARKSQPAESVPESAPENGEPAA